jgi:hypothetical protein
MFYVSVVISVLALSGGMDALDEVVVTVQDESGVDHSRPAAEATYSSSRWLAAHHCSAAFRDVTPSSRVVASAAGSPSASSAQYMPFPSLCSTI